MPTGKTVSGRKKSKVKKAEAKSKTRARRKMSKREAGKKADHNPAAVRRPPTAKIAEPSQARNAQPETGAAAKDREAPGLVPFMFWPFQIMRMWWPTVK